jgi:hypothetical protein
VSHSATGASSLGLGAVASAHGVVSALNRPKREAASSLGGRVNLTERSEVDSGSRRSRRFRTRGPPARPGARRSSWLSFGPGPTIATLTTTVRLGGDGASNVLGDAACADGGAWPAAPVTGTESVFGCESVHVLGMWDIPQKAADRSKTGAIHSQRMRHQEPPQAPEILRIRGTRRLAERRLWSRRSWVRVPSLTLREKWSLGRFLLVTSTSPGFTRRLCGISVYHSAGKPRLGFPARAQCVDQRRR